MRRCLLVGVILAVAAAAAACGSSSSGSGGGKDGLYTVRATVTPGVGSLPFEVAIKEGFFKKNGLAIKVTEGADFTSYLGSLDRQFDVVMLTAGTAVGAAGAGLPLKAFAGMESLTDKVPVSPYVTKDPDIKSIEDLARKGGTVASVSGLTATGKANLSYMLQGTGLNLDKLKFVTMPFSDMAAQLTSGRINVAGSAAGYYEPLLKQGYHIFYQSQTDPEVKAGGKLPLAEALFVSSTSFAEKHLDIVQKFQDSISEAEQWIDANKDAAVKILAPYTGVTQAFAEQTTMPVWKLDVEASDFTPLVKIYKSGGIITKPFDPQSLIVKGLK